MRAAPAFQVSLQRFGVWRAAIGALCAMGVIVLCVWLTTRGAPLASPSSLFAACTALLATFLGLSLWRVAPSWLRWDGQAWHLGPAADNSVNGDLTVAIDLGPWMLLRFQPNLTARVVWLPVQRRGLESSWHSLRCAVYSPRPAVVDESPAGF